ncbi:MAG: hypothetical protein GSR72_02935, partial [Desulfurococcales archaeon]|nr:hypothetical protein [Desulfurococcales archaeon]
MKHKTRRAGTITLRNGGLNTPGNLSRGSSGLTWGSETSPPASPGGPGPTNRRPTAAPSPQAAEAAAAVTPVDPAGPDRYRG